MLKLIKTHLFSFDNFRNIFIIFPILFKSHGKIVDFLILPAKELLWNIICSKNNVIRLLLNSQRVCKFIMSSEQMSPHTQKSL